MLKYLFISHALLCDILEVMMKPNPAHSLTQILERNITLFMPPEQGSWKEDFARSDNSELREIAKTMIITKTFFEYALTFTKDGLLINGTHTMLNPYLAPWNHQLVQKYKYNHGRGYYRGEKLASKSSYGGYFTSKNWHLNEENNLKYLLI